MFSRSPREQIDGVQDTGNNEHNDGQTGQPDIHKFPDTMKCTQAFDELIECLSLGGQFRNYYRYGEMNKCSRQNQKLRFCLKTMFKSEEQKKEMISSFYKTRLDIDRQKGNSEDIWELRKVPLVNPFQENVKYHSEVNIESTES